MRKAWCVLVLFFLTAFMGVPQIELIQAQEAPFSILIDYSHGQDANVLGREIHDPCLFSNLTSMGYQVTIATGGLNDSILEGKDCLLLGSIRGSWECGFSQSEIRSIQSWFENDSRFLWVAYDSDWSDFEFSIEFVNDNMSAVLESIGSHVYGEPSHVYDNTCNLEGAYKPYTNNTSDDEFVASMVENVGDVLMHGPTLLYGSNSSTPSHLESPIPLENNTIENVKPFLYYSPTAYLHDSDETPPIVHTNGQMGEFVACTIETNLGWHQRGTIIVSGSAPYGSYCPMFACLYRNYTLSGHILVLQSIEFGLSFIDPLPPPSPYETDPTTTSIILSPDSNLVLIALASLGIGVVILFVVFRKD